MHVCREPISQICMKKGSREADGCVLGVQVSSLRNQTKRFFTQHKDNTAVRLILYFLILSQHKVNSHEK